MKRKIAIILMFVISFASSHDLFINHITAQPSVHIEIIEHSQTNITNAHQIHHLLHFLAILDESKYCCNQFYHFSKFMQVAKNIPQVLSKTPERPPIA
jgi:hypothetical protein